MFIPMKIFLISGKMQLLVEQLNLVHIAFITP